MDRRQFGKLAAMGIAGLAVGSSRAVTSTSDRLNDNWFSKHVQFLD